MKEPASRGPRRGEIILAALLLPAFAPLFALIALGIVLADPGPVFYPAERSGLRGRVFRMYKFRTMRISEERGSRIAGASDTRVFAFGAILRKLKLDELPQLLNIVRGEMAFVGPRPEDPWFVDRVYTEQERETLNVLPGLTSPGTLYYYTHAEQFLDRGDPELSYSSGPMQLKLRLDRAYARNVTVAGDLRLAVKTVWLLARVAMGRTDFPEFGYETTQPDES